MLDDYIIFFQIRLIDGLILRFRIFLGKEDLNRHEGTVFLDDFSYTVLIGKFQAVFIQVQCHGGSYLCLGAIFHLIFRAAIAYPVNRGSAFLIRQRVNMHFIRYHEG